MAWEDTNRPNQRMRTWYKALAVARCARAEGGRLPAPFAGAVEGARAGPEPKYGHYSLHVSLA
eukprot:COSAG04_NODE_3646_length_2641_cov_1.857986_4_plen_62_part_01